ncbi:WD domain, G-beta repeat-containing protein [Cardiosporidium cionae]|uniref:WD domain, G-beta repeat-containing protein n=1 Tax=Cardiosporidium cionae TaxID=476202 RepID=A0ABQ7J8G3_9APIC|nr:WD domain, G-beta repeat-containing protein [Cardiosporidium cionae]|eukprot:KAF8820280.1 WD domain, G-beta repeat-containing protein [Cardiosporidium cionae]
MANVRTPAAPVHSSDLSASASTSARAATNLDTASAASPPSRTLPSAQSFQQLLKKDLQRTCDFFVGNVALKPTDLKACTATKIRLKLLDEYNFRPASSSAPFAEPLASVTALPSTSTRSTLPHRESVPFSSKSSLNEDTTPTISSTTNVPSHVNSSSSLAALSTPTTSLAGLIQEITGDGNDSRETHAYGGLAGNTAKFKKDSSTSYVGSEAITVLQPLPAPSGVKRSFSTSSELSTLTLHSPVTAPKPTWHAPWKLHRVISGHQGWVQCLSVDPTNEWFASGGNDRLLKIWDLASGTLKLTLTGHINTIRDLAISSRHPYLFSCAEDNRVKCWDLEQNKVVRDYHGHLSGVYCLALHPGIDILASGGRDAVVRVWDMRTKNAIYILNGHTGTIMSLQSQNSDPQLISGSQDKMIRLWDLKSGKCNAVLTHHKKSIRSMAIHPREYSFCSAASDNVKVEEKEVIYFNFFFF